MLLQPVPLRRMRMRFGERHGVEGLRLLAVQLRRGVRLRRLSRAALRGEAAGESAAASLSTRKCEDRQVAIRPSWRGPYSGAKQ